MNNIQIYGFLLKVFKKKNTKFSIDFVRVDTGGKKFRGRSKKEIQKDLDIVTAKSVYCNSPRSVCDLEKLLDTLINFVHDF